MTFAEELEQFVTEHRPHGALVADTGNPWASLGLLVLSLFAVVGLAKVLAPAIERAVAPAGAPRTVVGIAIASVALGIPLVLGLEEPKDILMLALSFLVSAVTLGTGRTHMMQGAVHLVMFAAFLFLAVVP